MMKTDAPSCLRFEGAFASRVSQYGTGSPYPQINPPTEGGTRAGPGGCILGRFGWMQANTLGFVSSVRHNAQDLLGFVLMQSGTWQKAYFDGQPGLPPYRVLRQGLPLSLYARGNFWARFNGGCDVGARVWASLVDGECLAGDNGNAELTPWTVATPATAGNLAIITTWSNQT